MNFRLPTLKDQQELVKQGLAVCKTNQETGHMTFKYHRRVMYDNLWSTNPHLMECRGHTYAPDGTLILLPFHKTFNYLENGHWKDVSDDTRVGLYKKHNGFMASVGSYDRTPIVGTTGTTDSDFVSIAKKHLPMKGSVSLPGATVMYEIIDENDPHIINEKPGAKPLGYRLHSNGSLMLGEPEIICSFGDAKKIAERADHEGYMVYLYSDYDQTVITADSCKLKSVYYTMLKRIIRSSKNDIEMMFKDRDSFCKKKKIDKDTIWYRLVLSIAVRSWVDEWIVMKEIQRRQFCEEFLETYKFY